MSTTLSAQTKYESLVNEFTTAKNEDTKESTKLTETFSLKAFDSIKDSMTDAMLKLEEFTNKGKKETIRASMGSKLIALIDKDRKHIGKWTKARAEDLKRESIEQETISNLLTSVKDHIMKKRNEIVDKAEYLIQMQKSTLLRHETYLKLEEEVQAHLDTLVGVSREKFDTQLLLTSIKQSIKRSQEFLGSYINPLILQAEVLVNTVQQNILPNLDNELTKILAVNVYNTDLQVFQDMVNTVQETTQEAYKTITKNIKGTIIETIEMMSNTGIDVKDFEKSLEEEKAYQNTLKEKIDNVQRKVETNLKSMSEVLEKSTLEYKKTPLLGN